jgi:uncharacterized membrane protein YczE
LALFGVGIAWMLEAGIGLDAWSTFHEGVSRQTGLSFGRVTQGVGLLFIAAAWGIFKERPGLGTLVNMAVVGPWVDLFRPLVPPADDVLWGVAMFLAGLAVVGFASGLYITAYLGAGPRDAFILGASRGLKLSIRVTRVGVEVTVLGLGYVLGGPVGVGTVIFALCMGPLMQLSLRRFGYEHASRKVGD